MHLSNRQLFLQHMAQTSPEPLQLEIVGAKGNYLVDANDKKYLDLISGISVSSLGHSHPYIIKAVKEQAETYMHLMVYGELVQAPQVKLAKYLVEQMPPALNSVYFVNSGAEAVEGAMKLAKRVTQRNKFVAQKKAYHGSTQGALGLMDSEYFTSAYRPLLPQIYYIEQNDSEAINAFDNDIAAIIIEPVQAEKGAIPSQQEYLQKLREFCDRTGALLVFDEIQTGMGRTGKLFAFEHYEVVPDILLLGKAFGGGMPLGAFIANKNLMGLLSHNPVLGHITTFGGHPVCCAAGLAALQLTVDGLPNFNIENKYSIFVKKLTHPKILQVTGMGLLLAVHLDSEQTCMRLIRYCIENGVFTDWFLHAPHALRIAPPLAITEEEINRACAVILSGLDQI